MVERTGSPATPRVAEGQPLRRIGEIAELVGVSLRTVRYYEEAGLVTPAARTVGGFRLYDEETVVRLRLILQMKPLGFTLDEMRLLAETRERLTEPGLTPELRSELRGRLEMFSAAAAEKLEQLRERLAIAESFSLQLDLETASALRRTSRRSAGGAAGR